MKRINVVDLFAGAGGLSEGFHRHGFNMVAYVEKDKNACDTLTTRQVYWKLYSENRLDIYRQYLRGELSREILWSHLDGFNPVINQEISKETLPEIVACIKENMKLSGVSEIDVFIGGPPCQAYSLVGRARDKYRMQKDPRNLLYKFYIELLKKFTPKIFVFENVPGILSAGKGDLWRNVQIDFKRAGYIIDYKILDSSDFGVLQRRKRVILIGWKKELNIKYPEFNIKHHTYTINNIFSDIPTLKAGEGVSIGSYIATPTNYLKIKKIRSEDDILIDHISRPLNLHDAEIYKEVINLWNKERKRLDYKTLPSHLKTHKNEKSFSDRFKVVASDLPYSHTLVAHIAKDGHYYIHPDIQQLRSISIREAARIQSFPDNYKFEGSRTSKFTQIGNAVPPLMAEEIAEKIKRML